MIKKIWFVLIHLFIVSCNNDTFISSASNSYDSIFKGNLIDESKDSIIVLKRAKIHERLIKKGIFTYLRNDSIFIFNNKKIFLTKCQLPKYGDILDFYQQLDTCYDIKQEKENKRLFITIRMPNTESDPSNFIIIDLTSNRIVLNITYSSMEHYIGSSKDGEYHAIEYGTSACGRGFSIYALIVH